MKCHTIPPFIYNNSSLFIQFSNLTEKAIKDEAEAMEQLKKQQQGG